MIKNAFIPHLALGTAAIGGAVALSPLVRTIYNLTKTPSMIAQLKVDNIGVDQVDKTIAHPDTQFLTDYDELGKYEKKRGVIYNKPWLEKKFEESRFSKTPTTAYFTAGRKPNVKIDSTGNKEYSGLERNMPEKKLDSFFEDLYQNSELMQKIKSLKTGESLDLKDRYFPGNEPAIFLHKDTHGYSGPILKHELGHALQHEDTEFMKDIGLKRIQKKENPSSYYESVIKNPKEDITYKLEADAWNRTDVPKEKLYRTIPLEGYEILASTPKYLHHGGNIMQAGGAVNSTYQGSQIGKLLSSKYNKNERLGKILGGIGGGTASIGVGNLMGNLFMGGKDSGKIHLQSLGRGIGNVGVGLTLNKLKNTLERSIQKVANDIILNI